MLRAVLLAASRSGGLRRLVESTAVTRPVVERFVAGTDAHDALRAARELDECGMYVSLDHLGEDVHDVEQANATVLAYQHLLSLLDAEGLAHQAEVSVKLSAVGQLLPVDGEKVALDNARRICASAAAAATMVTLDMEDHTTADSTLRVCTSLRADFPWVGAVLQAYLRRTEQDCGELAAAGARVRLCKGAYSEPASVAFQRKHEVDRSYVRCLKALMFGSAYPMVASHDPRMIAIAAELATRAGRTADDYEFQMLYGIRPEEQRRLVAEGHRLRVYVPYGDQWYGYFMRRLAERPANVGFFIRSLLSRG
jgi:proline dehydrogenase